MSDTLATIDDFLVPASGDEQTGEANPQIEDTEGQGGEDDPQPEGEPQDAKPEDELIDELADDTEEEADDVPPPPAAWGKDGAEAWKAMPPEAREIVAKRELEMQRFATVKGREIADARRNIETQAMEAVAQQAETFAQQLQALMAQDAPVPPNPELLYTGDQNDVLHYQRQDAAYRAGLAQQQQLQQRIGLSQQQADAARQQAEAVNAAAEAQQLQETLPEFFDPEEGPKLRAKLESVGSLLGYTPELMAQAGAADILALKTVAELHEKAAKYDRIVAKRMETVRAAKGMPKMSRPGAGQSSSGAAMATQEVQETAISQFNRDRSGDAALALLQVRKR